MILNDTVTLNGIKQDIYFKGKINASTFPQFDLNRIINTNYKIMQEDIRAINEDFFMVSAVTTLNLFSVNNGTYVFPLDYEKVKMYFAALNPANSASPLPTEFIRCRVIDAGAITNPSYDFTNPTIINFGNYFTLLPALTDTTIYPVIKGMKIYYIQKQPDLVNDTDMPNIFPDYHDVVSWGSLIDIAIRLGKQDLYDKAVAKFKERRAEMKADASNRILDPSDSIVEGQETQGGWLYPWQNNEVGN